MNKKDFIAAVAGRTGATKKDTAAFVDAYHVTVTDTLAKGDKITFVGFGGFSTAQVAERTGNNPRTREKFVIPARIRVKFKAGKTLKDALVVKKKAKAKKSKK